MKLLRFHLSTLLLLCVFAGSMLGLRMRREVWQLQYSAKMGAEEGGFFDVCKHHAPWLLGTKGSVMNSEANSGGIMRIGVEISDNLQEWSEIDSDRRAIRMSIHDKSRTTQNNVLVANLPTMSAIQWWAFSDDMDYLGIVSFYDVTVYYRTRGYGWTGFLGVPLFWVVLVSFLALCGAFARWIFRRHRVARHSVS